MTMKAILSLVACALVLGVAADARGQEPGSRVYGLEPIRLSLGWNEVPALTPDRLDGVIVMGWRDNGNAHGYDLFMVMVDTDRGERETWQVVGFEDPDGFADVIRDAPHVGEDMTRSVRFSRGVYEGKPATLVLVSTRQWSDQGIPHPTPAVIEIFDLRANTEGTGRTPYYFHLVDSFVTETAYCHAEMALHQELGLPLRRGYEGQATLDGC